MAVKPKLESAGREPGGAPPVALGAESPTAGGGDDVTQAFLAAPAASVNDARADEGQTLDIDSRGGSGLAGMATASFPAAAIDFDSGKAEAIDRTSTLEPGRGSTPGAEPNHVSKAGRRIGPYIVERELGRGGMGVVYLARHETLGRVVALKMILGGGQAGGDAQRRFLLEAQSIAKLSHPGIVAVFDIGEHEGLPYFSLEYVPGQSLADRPADELLEPRAAGALVAKMAAAMQYAHDRGVLHRDLKPSNVLLADEATPKITDFGLAKQIEDAEDSGLTQTGAIMGTPSYMSPEQASGDSARVGPPTDQYALGAILYHLLAGRAPFVAPRSYAVIKQVLSDEPVAPRKLAPQTPADLETICLKALHKDPTRRYPNCQALADDLTRFLDGRPIVARPAGPVERALRWTKRNPALASAGAVASLALIAVLSIITWSNVELSKKNVAISQVNAKLTEAKDRVEKTNTQLEGANVKLGEQNVLLEKRRQEAESASKEAYEKSKLASTSLRTLVDKSRELYIRYPQLRDAGKELIVAAADGLGQLPDDPADVVYRTGLDKARAEEFIFSAYMHVGEPSKALPHIETALAILEDRNAAQGTDDTRFNLANVLLAKAKVRQTVDRDIQESLNLNRRAIVLLEDVLDRPIPDASVDEKRKATPLQIRQQLVNARDLFVATLWQQGQIAEGLEQARLNLDVLDATYASIPAFAKMSPEQQRQARCNTAWLNQMRSVLALRAGSFDESRAQQNEALSLARLWVQASALGENTVPKRVLADVLGFSADLHAATDEVDPALADYQEAIALAREVLKMDSTVFLHRNTLNILLIKLAGFDKLRGGGAHSSLYQEAVAVAREMVKSDAKSQTAKVALGLSLAPAGEHLEASQIADGLLVGVKKPDAELLIDMARVYSQCGVAMMPPQPEDPLYFERAIDCVKRAIALGYADWFFLKNHPDFAPLQSEPGFVALLPAAK